MNVLIHGAFNLLMNAALAFWAALGIVVVALGFLRFQSARARILLLLLPFAKVCFELFPGIGESSFFWKRLAGVRHELGSFRVGFGVDSLGLSLRMELGSLYRGHWYSLSAADLLDTVLTVKVSPKAPGMVVTFLLLGAMIACARRAREWRKFSNEACHLRRTALLLQTRVVGRRRVAVLASSLHVGPPFAGGLFRPYVLFPSTLLERLTVEERRAVLEHELAHLAHFDVLVVTGVVWASDLFWFLPGCRWLVRQIRAEIELDADDAAVRAGADAGALATALVGVAEALTGVPAASLSAGRSPSSLVARAERLLGRRGGMRRSRSSRIAHAVSFALVVACVLQAVFLGNHATLVTAPH